MHIISLGGSIMAPDGVDRAYVDAFIDIVKGHKAIIVVGGGKLARSLMDDRFSREDNDRIGIAATHAHAAYLIAALRFAGVDVAAQRVAEPQEVSGHNVFVAGGFTPGRTTDDVAVQLAIAAKEKRVINLTNVDGVYDKDPREGDATRYDALSWNDYLAMFDTHAPGLHAPFDPVAARHCQEYQMQAVVCDGRDLEGLRRLLAGESIGTILK